MQRWALSQQMTSDSARLHTCASSLHMSHVPSALPNPSDSRSKYATPLPMLHACKWIMMKCIERDICPSWEVQRLSTLSMRLASSCSIIDDTCAPVPSMCRLMRLSIINRGLHNFARQAFAGLIHEFAGWHARA